MDRVWDSDIQTVAELFDFTLNCHKTVSWRLIGWWIEWIIPVILLSCLRPGRSGSAAPRAGPGPGPQWLYRSAGVLASLCWSCGLVWCDSEGQQLWIPPQYQDHGLCSPPVWFHLSGPRYRVHCQCGGFSREQERCTCQHVSSYRWDTLMELWGNLSRFKVPLNLWSYFMSIHRWSTRYLNVTSVKTDHFNIKKLLDHLK